MGNILIYADNGCDLDRELIDRWGIRLFHMSVNLDELTYKDRLNINPPEFYQLVAKSDSFPTTAQINPAEFQTEFEKIINQTEDEIIYIGFSSGLSGTYQSACIARANVDPNRITVIDSKSASIGYGLTVIRACQAVAAGKSKAEVIAEIEDNIQRMQHVFMVGNFDMLKKGGRISSASAAIGNLLNIKLILHFIDGKIVPLEKLHGEKKAKKRILQIMKERGHDLQNQTIGISYAVDYEGALEIKRMIEENIGCNEFLISEIGAVIGSHVGAGTFSVFFLNK